MACHHQRSPPTRCTSAGPTALCRGGRSNCRYASQAVAEHAACVICAGSKGRRGQGGEYLGLPCGAMLPLMMTMTMVVKQGTRGALNCHPAARIFNERYQYGAVCRGDNGALSWWNGGLGGAHLFGARRETEASPKTDGRGKQRSLQLPIPGDSFSLETYVFSDHPPLP